MQFHKIHALDSCGRPKYALVLGIVLHALWLLLASGCSLPNFPFFAFLTPPEESYQLRTIDSIDLENESTTPPEHLSEAANTNSSIHTDSAVEELPPPDPTIRALESDSSPRESTTENLPVPPAARLILTLADARASALDANLDLRIVQVDPAIARQVISQEAGRFEATFNSTYVRNRLDPPPGVLAGGPPDTTFDLFTNAISQPLISGGEVRALHNFTKSDIHGSSALNSVDTDMGLEFRQPLLRGFGYQVATANIQIARAQTGIADARSKLTAIRVLADTERVYWQLYAAHKFHEIALQQLELAKQQYIGVQQLVKAGVFTNVEALVAEAGVMVREDAAIQTETNVRIVQRDLKRIMQRPDAPVEGPTNLLLATDPNPLGLEFSREALVSHGIVNRMEMLELQLRLLADSLEREVRRNSTLPRLDIMAEIDAIGLESSYRKSMGVLLDNDFGDRLVGIALEVPLSGNVSAQARLREVQLRMVQTRIEQERVSVLITQEVNDAVDRVEQNWERIVATRRAEFSAERAYQGQLRLQEAGQRTITDVLVALQSLGEARAQAVQAVTDYQIAKVDLALAVGAMLGYGQVDWNPCSGPQSLLPDVVAQVSADAKETSLLLPGPVLLLPSMQPVTSDELKTSSPWTPFEPSLQSNYPATE